MNRLEIEWLNKSYGQRRLLQLRRLTLAPAQAYVLTGRNGSGKTSLLRILAGLESADLGPAQFEGQALSWLPMPPHLRSQIGYVHQLPVALPGSVRDNIAFGLRCRSTPPTECSVLVDVAMEWAGLQTLQDQPAHTLSGGELQRMALARASVLQPRLLLLDEPTSHLDGEAREQVLALIPDLIARGTTVLVVCHDRDLITLPGMVRWKLQDGSIEQR